MLAVYAAALALLAVNWAEPLFILVIAGGFTLAAWLATRGMTPLEGVNMRAPLWGIVAYLVFLGAVLAIGSGERVAEARREGCWSSSSFRSSRSACACRCASRRATRSSSSSWPSS